MTILIDGKISTGEIIRYTPRANQEIQDAFFRRFDQNPVPILNVMIGFSGQDLRTMTISEAKIAIPTKLGGGLLTENVVYQTNIKNGKPKFTTGKNHWWLRRNLSPGEVVLTTVYNKSRSSTQN